MGHFTGRNVTDSWSCPTWFDATVCDNVVAVYRGMATYTSPSNHPGTFLQEYVVTNVGGQEILQQYFVDLFYCPGSGRGTRRSPRTSTARSRRRQLGPVGPGLAIRLRRPASPGRPGIGARASPAARA